MRAMNGGLPVAAGALVGAALLAGCASVDNDRLSVSPQPIPLFDPDPEDAFEPAEGPSITSLDRSHWPAYRLEASADSVAHHAAATRVGPRFASKSRRQRDQAPSGESALTMGADAGGQLFEGLAGPFFGGIDALLIVPRMIVGDFEKSGGTGWVWMRQRDDERPEDGVLDGGADVPTESPMEDGSEA